MLKKKIWANFLRIKVLFTQKIVTRLSKIWVWDLGSGKKLFGIPDPGVKKAPDPGSGSATLLILKMFTETLLRILFSVNSRCSLVLTLISCRENAQKLTQAASGRILQNHKQRPVIIFSVKIADLGFFEAGHWKDFQN
jgi:hypothetical protein